MRATETSENNSIKIKLSILWIFLVLNYLYCDVLTLMDPHVLQQLITGTIDGLKMTESFLLAASVLMEIPIALSLISRLTPYGFNRWANIIAGMVMALVQLGSLFVGTGPTSHYLFFSIIEVTTALYIAWTAIKWKNKD